MAINGFGSGDWLKFKPDKNFSAQSFCQTKSQNQQRFATVLRRRLPCVSSPPRCFLVLVPTQSCSGRHFHPLLYPPYLHGQACRCCCLRKFVSKLKRQSKMQLCSTTRSTIIRFHYNLLSYARNFDWGDDIFYSYLNRLYALLSRFALCRASSAASMLTSSHYWHSQCHFFFQFLKFSFGLCLFL